MADIKAADVKRLRELTGAGMMDCKKALQEAEGDFEQASDIIRKKGQAIANKRGDREAAEGVVLSSVNSNKTSGAMVVLNCETDFVARNDNFVKFANSILELALVNLPADLNALIALDYEGKKLEEAIIEQSGIIGEKLELSFYEKIEAKTVVAYIHPGNQLATLVGVDTDGDIHQVVKDIAMQIAAMNPVSIDKEDVPENVIEKELEIGREQARQEGKPENLVDRIAQGKLNKFFKESTLMNQDFVKDSKMTIAQYIDQNAKGMKVTKFKRFSLK